MTLEDDSSRLFFARDRVNYALGALDAAVAELGDPRGGSIERRLGEGLHHLEAVGPRDIPVNLHALFTPRGSPWRPSTVPSLVMFGMPGLLSGLR